MNMKKILVVDDELGIRILLSEILEDEGYEVHTAEDAVSARQLVRDIQFDLILLDIWMPDTDGITLLKEWKRAQSIPCPVIMMSGHGTIETAMESTRFGAMDFLEKPITLKKLLETCQRVLEQWESIKEANAATIKRQTITATNRPGQSLPTQHNAYYRVIDSGIPTAAKPEARIPIIEIPALGIVLDFNRNFRDMRDEFERAYLSRVLEFRGGSVSALSKHSELERTHLYRKLKGLGIDPVKFISAENRDRNRS